MELLGETAARPHSQLGREDQAGRHTALAGRGKAGWMHSSHSWIKGMAAKQDHTGI